MSTANRATFNMQGYRARYRAFVLLGAAALLSGATGCCPGLFVRGDIDLAIGAAGGPACCGGGGCPQCQGGPGHGGPHGGGLFGHKDKYKPARRPVFQAVPLAPVFGPGPQHAGHPSLVNEPSPAPPPAIIEAPRDSTYDVWVPPPPSNQYELPPPEEVPGQSPPDTAPYVWPAPADPIGWKPAQRSHPTRRPRR